MTFHSTKKAATHTFKGLLAIALASAIVPSAAMADNVESDGTGNILNPNLNPAGQVTNGSQGAVAIGAPNSGQNQATAGSTWSIAVGSGAVAGQNGAGTSQGFGSIAVGALTNADNSSNTAADPTVDGGPSYAIGFNADATNKDSLAVGTNVQATGYQSTALGAGAQSRGTYSVALGGAAYTNPVTLETFSGASAFSNSSIAIGRNSVAGQLANPTIVNSIAIGTGAVCGNNNSSAFGAGATCTADNQVVLGTAAQTVRVPGAINTNGISNTGNITNTGNISTNTLGVSGLTTTNGIANTGNIGTTTLNVTGQSTLANTQVNGTLGVTGLTTTAGIANTGNIGTTTLNVSGLSTLTGVQNNGNLNNTGNLTVGGNTTLNGNTTINGNSTTINSRNITIGAADKSSVVRIPGIRRGGDSRFVSVNSNGRIGSSDYTIKQYDNALSSVDDQVSSVGAMAAALSAIPTLTTGEKNFACGVGTGAFGSTWAGAVGCVGKVASNVWVNGALSFTPSIDTSFGTSPSVGGRLGVFFQF